VNDHDRQNVLNWQPVGADSALVADPVRTALSEWKHAEEVRVAAIDPDLADTADFCQTYGVALEVSANCVIVAGRRGAETRYAACMVLATTRADVNGVVRRLLDARKASFAAMDDAVSLTGMEYGGITPIGLPTGWPVLVAAEVVRAERVIIGSGIRGSKLQLPGAALLDLPDAQLVGELARA
jgi:prolyl-tRNA editing enzyme YbaK/EbsC (Cys-tRNA(Pro) deacylase)